MSIELPVTLKTFAITTAADFGNDAKITVEDSNVKSLVIKNTGSEFSVLVCFNENEANTYSLAPGEGRAYGDEECQVKTLDFAPASEGQTVAVSVEIWSRGTATLPA